MQRKLPPKIKIYEALGALADERIQVEGLLGNEGKCYSSSGNKYYTITYDANQNAIMTNDNGSFWQGYLGYPAIAFLMKIGTITYEKKYADALKDIKRKDINQEFKNDFNKTEKYILEMLEKNTIDIKSFLQQIDDIYNQIEKLNLSMLGKKIQPPKGY